MGHPPLRVRFDQDDRILVLLGTGITNSDPA